MGSDRWEQQYQCGLGLVAVLRPLIAIRCGTLSVEPRSAHLDLLSCRNRAPGLQPAMRMRGFTQTWSGPEVGPELLPSSFAPPTSTYRVACPQTGSDRDQVRVTLSIFLVYIYTCKTYLIYGRRDAFLKQVLAAASLLTL